MENKSYTMKMDDSIGNVDLTEGEEEEVNSIPTNLYARAMRLMMEDKNLLKNRGSIYVGTGKTQTVQPVPDGPVYEIPITAPLNPPLQDGIYELQCVVRSGEITLQWYRK